MNEILEKLKANWMILAIAGIGAYFLLGKKSSPKRRKSFSRGARMGYSRARRGYRKMSRRFRRR